MSPQSPVKVVYFVCGTQVGKSTINLILIAYRIDCVIRGPILAMHAVKEMATAWAKDELDETIAANQYMADVLERAGKKEAYLFRKWPGASLIIRGGASGTAFAKISASLLLLDDLDRFKMNIGGTTGKNKKIGEGSPLELLFDRVSGRFGNYKVFANSSPKAEGESIIWPAFKTTDQNHFYVACPKCGYMQTWEFENLVFPHKEYVLTEEPYIECQNTDCKHPVYERNKYKVLQNWEYRPAAKGLDPLVKGYRVSSLYSMLGYSLTQYANDWLSACKTFDEEGDDTKKIRHRNTKQAKPWKRKVGKKIEHSALYKTRISLNPLPENCVLLGAGVDIQDDRIEIQVKGYGEHSMYFIDHVKFGGDPAIKLGQDGSPWNLLEDFINNKRYTNVFGSEQPIYSISIDLGFLKDNAKDFILRCDQLYFQEIFGVFGKVTTAATINFVQNVTKDQDGFESWGLAVNLRKKAIYNLLSRHLQGKEFLYFSDRGCFSEKWFRQLTIERPNEKGIFEKPHDHARNEALDCSNYADSSNLLAFVGGVDWESFKVWNKLGCQITGSNEMSIISEGERV